MRWKDSERWQELEDLARSTDPIYRKECGERLRVFLIDFVKSCTGRPVRDGAVVQAVERMARESDLPYRIVEPVLGFLRRRGRTNYGGGRIPSTGDAVGEIEAVRLFISTIDAEADRSCVRNDRLDQVASEVEQLRAQLLVAEEQTSKAEDDTQKVRRELAEARDQLAQHAGTAHDPRGSVEQVKVAQQLDTARSGPKGANLSVPPLVSAPGVVASGGQVRSGRTTEGMEALYMALRREHWELCARLDESLAEQGRLEEECRILRGQLESMRWKFRRSLASARQRDRPLWKQLDPDLRAEVHRFVRELGHYIEGVEQQAERIGLTETVPDEYWLAALDILDGFAEGLEEARFALSITNERLGAAVERNIKLEREVVALTYHLRRVTSG